MDFSYNDFDSLEDYKAAIGDLFETEPLTIEIIEKVKEHLKIYKSLKNQK